MTVGKLALEYDSFNSKWPAEFVWQPAADWSGRHFLRKKSIGWLSHVT